MKKLMLSSLLGLFLGAAVVACGGNAQAAQSSMFNFDAGYQVVGISPVHTFTVYGGGAGYFTIDNGTAYNDPTGALFARIKASAAFLPFFQFGTNTWVNTSHLIKAQCSGNTSQLIWDDGSNQYLTDTGCAGYNTLHAASN